MVIKIRGFGDSVFKISAQEIIALYIQLAFWVSPFAFWKIWEIIKPYLGA